jgi:hypothetical protein
MEWIKRRVFICDLEPKLQKYSTALGTHTLDEVYPGDTTPSIRGQPDEQTRLAPLKPVHSRGNGTRPRCLQNLHSGSVLSSQNHPVIPDHTLRISLYSLHLQYSYRRLKMEPGLLRIIYHQHQFAGPFNRTRMLCYATMFSKRNVSIIPSSPMSYQHGTL